MNVEIVVPYNDEKILRKVFLRSRDLKKTKLVLVENGNNPVGLPELFNAHKRTSTADWLIFCHQDFVVYERGWINKILALEPDACYGPTGVNSRGRLLGRTRQTNGKFYGHAVPLAEVSTLDEMCIVIPRSIYQKVDFDSQFSFDFYVCDYCLQAKSLGYPTRVVQLHCQHKSRTIEGAIESPRYADAKKLFIRKHRDMTPLVTTTFQLWPKYWTPPERNPTLSAELELVGANKRVLEIGPGGGHMTEALSQRGCKVTSIEADPKLAVRVKSFCERLVVGDIEQLDLDCELHDERFDVILLGDVLEHLKDTAKVLVKLKPLLRSSGHLVVSLPNIAHASIRLALHMGEFNYTDAGLLDRTHLRFFTLNTILDLFRESGYQIHNIRRARLGFFNTETLLDPGKFPVSLLRTLTLDSEASTYQFIFSATVNNRALTGNIQFDDIETFLDPEWSPRRERKRLARDLVKIGIRKMQNHQLSQARAVFYRSMRVKPGGRALFYLLRSCFPFGAAKPRRAKLVKDL